MQLPSALTDRREELWQAVRFIVAGAGNALLTAGLTSGLATVVDPRAAYVVAYAVGLVTATYLVSKFVFGARLTGARAVKFGALYVTVFLIGLLALQVALNLGLPDHLSGGVILVTAPLSFLGSRLIFPPDR